MKILLLTDRMDAGGAETHVAQLARGLRAAELKVTLISQGGRLANRLAAEGIEQLTLPLSTHNPFKLLGARRRIKRLVKREGFEILHAHARTPAFLLHGCEKWRLPDGRHPVSIVTAHAYFGGHGLLSYWGKRTVAVSEDIRLHLCRRYRRPAESIRVIPNGVDCEVFSPLAERREQNEPPRILFASRLDADCSLGALLLCRIAPRLYRDFPTLRITLVGGGSELERITDLSDTLNRALGTELIRVWGHCEDMPSLLREQDVFVGVSRCAMEAGACGCAIILCGNEGYGGILSTETAKYAMLSNLCGRGSAMPDEKILESDLRLLLSDRSLCHRLGEECRALVRTHFSADGMCRSMLSLYHSLLPAHTDITLVIGGYFGCGNLGDDAILMGFLEALRSITPRVRVIALTGNPSRDEKRFGVECINRKDPFATSYAFLIADAFLCGGGSLLQNLTSRRSLSYYLWLLRHAKQRGALPILYAAGIGPLVGSAAKKKVSKMLSRCAYISLRDPESKKMLISLGIDPAILFDGADPALLLPTPPPSRAHAILREHGISPSQGLICVALRSTEEPMLLTRLFPAALRILSARHGLLPVFITLDAADKDDLLQRAARACGGIFLSLRESSDATAILSVSRLVLSMRLHALILAATVGTPAVGVPADLRDAKIPSFARAVGQEFLPPNKLTVGNLVASMERALSQNETNRPILADSVLEMRKKARKDLANILLMIYNRYHNDEQIEKGWTSL